MSVFVCAVSSCGMLSRQEELSDTSGTNQRMRAQGHGGSERRLKKGKPNEGEKRRSVSRSWGHRSSRKQARRSARSAMVCPRLIPASAGGEQVCLYMQEM